MKVQPHMLLVFISMGLLIGWSLLSVLNLVLIFYLYTTVEASPKIDNIVFADLILVLVASLIGIPLAKLLAKRANLVPLSEYRSRSKPVHLRTPKEKRGCKKQCPGKAHRPIMNLPSHMMKTSKNFSIDRTMWSNAGYLQEFGPTIDRSMLSNGVFPLEAVREFVAPCKMTLLNERDMNATPENKGDSNKEPSMEHRETPDTIPNHSMEAPQDAFAPKRLFYTIEGENYLVVAFWDDIVIINMPGVEAVMPNHGQNFMNDRFPTEFD